MVKANDLRLGNYVNSINGYVKIDVEQLIKSAFAGATNQSEFSNFARLFQEGDIQPIPLTAEILEACGFANQGVSVDSNWHYKLISIPTNFNNAVYELSLFTTDEVGKYGINLENQYFGYCKSLHQLQNVFYMLVGEELEVNLKELQPTN